MGTEAPDLDTLVSELARKLSAQIRLDRILLFGSHARREAGPDSDVDLVVVSPDFAGRDYLESVTLVRQCLPPSRNFDVDALPRTPEELAAAAPDSFLATILEDAVVVYPRPGA